jgi:hypothetical protein
MAELDFAFLADFARSKFNSLDALGIGFDTIMAPALPASHQLFLALKIAFDQVDCETTHRIEAIVQDTDGRRLSEVLINLEAEWPDEDPLGDRVFAQAVLPLVLPLVSAGVHSLDIAIDGENVKTITFAVRVAE